eukprot:CAMPEP_0205819666 /NCGR_PEP_ID=MMETSP0206-20130828/2132_1 /ASSEMBLY_ACC=CAM_ASM_000279 /TAXON_ID=36767 /ORGANISM="Euplotes focardii, Strain TN1" /LENGTH=250 /DNA_ID=CAMNT_0053113529 /DNA_START=42 /DNA_END=794 /DNA_ORIENTATION=+
MNEMFHSHMTPHKKTSGAKLMVPKNKATKTPAKLNISHISKSSNRSIGHSRSTHSLPRIIGNDLKMIKEIFTKAKKYRMKHAVQKIPVKVMTMGMEKIPKPAKSSRSIPKYKNSSKTINSKNQYSIEKPSKKDIGTLKKSSAFGKQSESECSKQNYESCPHLPELDKNEKPPKSKFGRKKSPPKYQLKYGVQVSRDSNGNPITSLTQRKMKKNSKKDVKGTMSTKDYKSELMSTNSGDFANSEIHQIKHE